ncbi:MAG: zinc ribbon domain-containing protein YjdM [Rhabdochlamydiaceae bacterium]|nr:zinc ribbon domain-containing protein YjdM [Candidatus Amphrikana amoebophyrae]
MTDSPKCPKCGFEYTYQSGNFYVCPECAYEWSAETEVREEGFIVKDANGQILNDGDNVTVVKDIKVKGSSTPMKVGLKIKGIRLVDGPDGHNIEVKAKGFGQLYLKSQLVKKST